MADKKISALTAATTPLAGTEVLPIVQGGSTVKVAVSDLTAGRTVSASTMTLTNPLSGANGGTGLSSFTSGGVVYASSTSALTTGSNLYFSGTSLGVGTQSPNQAITTQGGNFAVQSTTTSGSTSVGFFTGYSDRNGSNYQLAKIDILTGSFADAGQIDIYTKVGAGALTKAVNISSAQNITVSVGNVVQGTAAQGFDFSANSTAAGKTSTLLNWYEEGAFTPTLLGGTNAGTWTYSYAQGYYTRIGRQVTFCLRVTAASTSGATGQARVGGLPYALGTWAGRADVKTDAPSGLTGYTTITSILGTFVSGSNVILADASGVAVDASAFTNTTSVDINGTYFV